MVKSRVVLLGVVLLFAAAGCDRGATKAGPSCETAAAQVITALAGGEKSVNTMEVKSAVTKRCTDDKWTDDARECIAKAQSSKELATCTHDKLTGTQVDHLDDTTSALSVGVAEAMKKMREFTDKMCACKDAKCAQDVSDEMTKWSMEMAKTQKEPPKMSEKDMKDAQEMGMRMGECMTKAMGVGEEPLPGEDVRHGEPHEGDRTPEGHVIVK